MGVVVMMSLVNGLLLAASAKFLGQPVTLSRVTLGACTGSLMVGVSLLPGFSCMNSLIGRVVFLAVASTVAFGIRRMWLSKLLFVLLHLSLGGIAATETGLLPMLLGSAGIALACFVVGNRETLIPVEIFFQDGIIHLTALRDTGNTLTDPVTGSTVLVVDATVARRLTGLTPQQLRTPVETMGLKPGLRQIPYRTVDQNGFLLAMKMAKVKIGSWQGSVIVAFSPQELGSRYQALTGGMI